MALTPLQSAIRSLALAASLLLPLWGSAGSVEKNPIGKGTVQVAEAHPMYLGSVNAGIKTNDAYTDGNFSIVAPLWSTLGAESTLSGGLLFLEPYISYGEGGEVAASLGLGYRHLFGTQSVSALTNHDGHQAGFFEEGAFIGANVFVDMLDTDSNNQFWQLGVGLEAGTRYVEFRGNYYIPLSDRQLAEERRSRETFRTSSSSSGTSNATTVTPLGDPFATGNTVSQDGLFTNSSTRITRTTTTTTTIERLFQRFEEGMEGWDAEVAVLVPGLDRHMDVMLIGGYYSFDNQPFGPQLGGTGNVEGWKAGIEVRPVPALILSGTWYEDERLTGSDWTAGVQIQVPFEAGDLGDGKGFWDRIGDAFTPRRRHLMERLAEPVGRQNAAVKIANSFQESQKVVSRTSSTKVTRSTRVVSQTAQRVVLADDIVFVNNGGDVGNGIVAGDTEANGADGTAELAYDNIVEGALKAGAMSNNTGRVWKVYTQGGTGLEYQGSVVATGSTRFISSFTPLVTLGNTHFGGGTDRPAMFGNIVATGIGYLQVTGYDVRTIAAPTPAIDVLNVQELLVTNNITSAGSGIRATTNNGTTSTVNASLNQLSGPGSASNGIELISRGGSTINTDIRDNQLFGGFGDGISLRDEDTAVIDGIVANNLITGSYQFTGIDVDHTSEREISVDVVNNTLSGAYNVGVRATASGATNASVLNANVQGNILSGTYLSTGMSLLASNAARNISTAQGNQFSGGFTTDGLFVQTTTTASTDVSILNNTFSGGFANGVQFTANGSGSAAGTVQGNTFSGNFGRGIFATKQGAASSLTATDVNVLGNTFSGNFSDSGILYSQPTASSGGIVGRVEGNVLSGAFTLYGVQVHACGNITNVDVLNNQLSGTFAIGIGLNRNIGNSNPGKLRGDVVGNQLSGTFSTTGIHVDHRGAAPADASFIGDVTVIDNVLTGNFTEGIVVSATAGSQLNVTVSNNTVEAGATTNTTGMRFLSGAASVLTVSGFDGNVISGAWQTGIRLERGAAGAGSVTVNGTLNAASNNEVSGELGNKVDIINLNVEPISGNFFLNGSQVNLPMVVD